MTTERREWGFWATLLWSVAILILFAAAQIVFISGYVYMGSPAGGEIAIQETLERLRTNGDVIALATLIGAAVGMPAVFGVMRLKRGAQLAAYFPVHLPTLRAAAPWLAATVIWIVASDLISLAIDEPIVPPFMREAYGSASSKTLLWIALLVAAPLFEETLFRGFMLPGLVPSKIGPAGAIVVTAFIWALIHTQYDLNGRIAILIFGVILGAARVTTGTMLAPLSLHVFANLVATLEVILLPTDI